VAAFFARQLQLIPVIGKWASRIGSTVTEFLFTVVQTLIGFLRIAFGKKQVWAKVM